MKYLGDFGNRIAVIRLQNDRLRKQWILRIHLSTSALDHPRQFQFPDLRAFSGRDLLGVELVVVADLPGFVLVPVFRIRAVGT